MNRAIRGILWFAGGAASAGVIPLAALLGLLILGTDANARHPPGDVMGEAVGWAIVGAWAGAMGAIIGGASIFPSGKLFGSKQRYYYRQFNRDYRGCIAGDRPGCDADGQAITSVRLAILSGATVGTLGGAAGAIIGTALRRAFLAVSS